MSDGGVRRWIPGVGNECGAITPQDRSECKSLAAAIRGDHEGTNESVSGAGPQPMHFGEGRVPGILVVNSGKSGFDRVCNDLPSIIGSQPAFISLAALPPLGRNIAPLTVRGGDGRKQEEAWPSVGSPIKSDPVAKADVRGREAIGRRCRRRRWR